MLSADHRLRHRRDFQSAVRGGQRVASGAVVAHLLCTPPVQAEGTDGTSAGPVPARVGFVVSGAVGPAVVRNRVRRRLRHLCADRLSRLPAGSLLVVRALPAAGVMAGNAADLATDVDRVLDRVLETVRELSAGPSAGPSGVPEAAR